MSEDFHTHYITSWLKKLASEQKVIWYIQLLLKLALKGMDLSSITLPLVEKK